MKNPIIEAGLSSNPGVLLLKIYEEPRKAYEGLVVGSDGRMELLINEDGEIILIEEETAAFRGFMNSGVEEFIRTVEAYRSYKNEKERCETEEEEIGCARSLEETIKEIDEKALGEEGWWTCVIERALEGNG